MLLSGGRAWVLTTVLAAFLVTELTGIIRDIVGDVSVDRRGRM